MAFVNGQGLSSDTSAKVDQFIGQLAGGLNLWKGPLSLQDGTVYLTDGCSCLHSSCRLRGVLRHVKYLCVFMEGTLSA